MTKISPIGSGIEALVRFVRRVDLGMEEGIVCLWRICMRVLTVFNISDKDSYTSLPVIRSL